MEKGEEGPLRYNPKSNEMQQMSREGQVEALKLSQQELWGAFRRVQQAAARTSAGRPQRSRPSSTSECV